MSSETWATALAAEILNRSGNGNGAIMMATVVSPSPLTIKLYDQIAARNLYINPAYLLTDAENRLADLPDGSAGEFLRAFHKAFTLSAGDQLVVLVEGNSFYVLEKVVRA
ncbi:hypothetical protein AALB39_18170 [Lachnospiraceae bacterium 54-53]